MVRTISGIAVLSLSLTLGGCAASAPEASSAAPTSVAVVSQAAVPSDPDEALKVALEAEDVDALKAALAAGADPNGEIGPDVTALMSAILRGNPALVGALIDGGADITARDGRARTPLILASEDSTPEVVELLLAAGGSLEDFSDENPPLSPLHAAAHGQNPDTLDVLLQAGANPDVRDPVYQATPLMTAAYFNCPDCAYLLILNGADIDAVGPDGQGPLSIARARGNADVVAILEDAGATT